MEINEIVIDGATLWVPSPWVTLNVIHYAGRLSRYRVWQTLSMKPICSGPFDFAHAYDADENKTWASVFSLTPEIWALLPLPDPKIRVVTSPKAMAHQHLPKQNIPFALAAYRWQGEVELCAYRLGLLQYAERGQGGDAGVGALWSRVVQALPVYAVAPLYTREASLKALFQTYHGACHEFTA